MASPVVAGDPKSVARYYAQTWLDYRALWMDRENRALHFGYWDERTRSHGESLANVNRVLADDIEPKPGQLLLDAGCGVGGTAMWLAANYDVAVVGITVSPHQAARCRRYAAERRLTGRVSFSVQDDRQTSFPDEAFDVVYAVESVCYAPDKADFIAEAYRVLKPGGRMVVHDGFAAARPLSEAEERLQQSWLSGYLVPNLPPLDRFVEVCEAAGFVNVQAQDLTAHYRRSCRRLRRISVALSPLELLLHRTGLRSEVQHGNVRAARDQWTAMERGLWVHATVVGDKP